MEDILKKYKFNDWLLNLDIAPYPSMFYDIPKFIQYSYIQKWLREVHKIEIYIEKMIGGGSGNNEVYIGVIYQISIDGGINSNKETNYVYDIYEEALEASIKEGLKLINKTL